MSCKHGGAAFPQVNLKDYQGLLIPDLQKGMTLRDYFAAKALIGIMADPADTQPYTNDELANWCYQVADAMLKAREE